MRTSVESAGSGYRRLGHRRPVAAALLTMSVIAFSAGCADQGTSTSSGLIPSGEVCCVATNAGAPSVVNGIATDHNGWDIAFVNWFAPHDAVAAQMAELAVSRAVSPKLRAIAEQIDDEQSTRYVRLVALASAWGQPTPSTDPNATSGHDHGSTVGGEVADAETLQKTIGPAFDQAFVAVMTAHHIAGLAEARATLDNGVNPQAKTLAESVIVTQQATISALRELSG